MIKYKFCPQCKTKLDSTGEYPYCPNCKLTIYLDSKPTASILIISGNKVLLGKRAIEPFKGKYDVVGGFLKYGEDPITGVLREAKEETGLTIKITDFLGICMDTYGKGGDYTLNIYYVGEIVSGKMEASDDVAKLEWFDINKLPKPAFKNQEKVFKDLQKWYGKNK
jgi:ADP-ribose pyrophosphatase YjhB (NUDIX family)